MTRSSLRCSFEIWREPIKWCQTISWSWPCRYITCTVHLSTPVIRLSNYLNSVLVSMVQSEARQWRENASRQHWWSRDWLQSEAGSGQFRTNNKCAKLIFPSAMMKVLLYLFRLFYSLCLHHTVEITWVLRLAGLRRWKQRLRFGTELFRYFLNSYMYEYTSYQVFIGGTTCITGSVQDEFRGSKWRRHEVFRFNWNNQVRCARTQKPAERRILTTSTKEKSLGRLIVHIILINLSYFSRIRIVVHSNSYQ